MNTNTNTMTGSVWDLAQWFQSTCEVPEYGADLATSFADSGMDCREEIMNEASRFTAWGVDKSGRVLLRTPKGRVLIELVNTVPAADGDGCHLCRDHCKSGSVALLTWLPRERTTAWRTWFNKSSISYLGDAIRNATDKQTSFDQIFIQS